MKIKEFFKPDLRKIVIFVILAVVLFNINWWWIPEYYDFIYYQGLPLPVYYEGGFPGYPKTFIPINFVINIIIWYIISCLTIFIYNKFKKNKKKRRK